MEQNAGTLASREAIIFIPGFGPPWEFQSVDTVARQLATELDRNARTARARFTVRRDPYQQQGQHEGSGVRTIVRHDSNGETPVADVYGLPCYDTLVQRFEQRNLIIRSLLLLLVLFAIIPRFVFSLLWRRNRGKRAADTLQVLYGFGVLSLLVVYTGTLLVAAYQLALQVPALVGRTAELPTITTPQAMAIVLALVGAFFPNAREYFSKAAVNCLAIIAYLLVGERRAVVCGQLATLLEHVASRGDTDYARIHVVGYSFGSIVAIDALFPQRGPLGRRFELVDTLVTIGCLFDLIRAFWPGYFQERHGTATTFRRWLNISMPADALGSTFRDDNRLGAADKGVALKSSGLACPTNLFYDEGVKRSVWGWLALMGLRSHSMYWGTEEGEASCFGLIVRELFADSNALTGRCLVIY